MSSALEGFLLRNELYDASDTCLMLVGAATVAISQDTSLDLKLTEGQNIVTLLSSVESPKLETIWPVRCLLKMAVVRNCLRSTLLVLNAAIPNELRWRAPQRIGVVSTKRPSLGLFVALVGTILESSTAATRVLLDLLDEESGMPFWFSIPVTITIGEQPGFFQSKQPIETSVRVSDIGLVSNDRTGIEDLFYPLLAAIIVVSIVFFCAFCREESDGTDVFSVLKEHRAIKRQKISMDDFFEEEAHSLELT